MKKFLIACIILLFSTNCFSQEKSLKPIRLGEMVVTATRTKKSILDVPASVTVLTEQKLRDEGGRNLIESLKYTPGLSYLSFGPLGITHGGMNSEINIRGTTGQTLILMNGIPIIFPAHGMYDINEIPLGMIKKVEIVKGAASTLYGSGAFGGVINIITKKPEEMKNMVSFEGGNRHYYHATAVYHYRNLAILGNYRYVGSLGNMSWSRSFSGGGNYYDFHKSSLYNTYLTYQISDQLQLNYLYVHQNADYSYLSGRTYLMHQDEDKHYTNLIYDNGSIRAIGFFNYSYLSYQYERGNPYQPGLNQSVVRDSLSGLDFQYHKKIWDIDTVTGFRYEHDWVLTTIYKRHYRNNFAPFFRLSYEILPGLNLAFGGRYQWVWRDEGENKEKFCPQIQLNYRPTESLSFYTNIGRAFRMPTITQLYWKEKWMIPNPDLEPEVGWTYEIGMKYEGDKISFSISPYYMKLTNKITYITTKTWQSKPVNMSKFTNPGVEYNFSYRITENLKFMIGGYWGDPETEEKGKSYRSGDKFQIAPQLRYKNHNLDVNVNAVFLESRAWSLRPYRALNFLIRYKLWKGEAIFAMDNVIDRNNVTTGNRHTKWGWEYYDTPRMFRIGYRVSF